MSPSAPTLPLAYGLTFEDLHDRDGLIRVDAAFLAHVKAGDMALFNRLMAGRADPAGLADKEESQLLIDLAPHLEDFLGSLFGVAGEMRALRSQHDRLAPLYEAKRLFVQRRAAKAHKPDE